MQKIILPQIRFNPQTGPMPEMRQCKYKVTVCLVPYKNDARFLRTLEAVKKAGMVDWEIIIVDNNYVSDIKQKCGISETVRYFHNANKGQLAGATNVAIRESQANYIVYVCTNHVKIYSNDWLRHMVEYFADARKKRDFVLGGDIRPVGHGSDRHVQGGVWIGYVPWLLKYPYDEKKFPFTFMDVYISRTAVRDRKQLLQIPGIHSVMEGWRKRDDASNTVVKKYKIVHAHGL